MVEVIKSSEGSHRGARRVSTGTSAFLSEDRWHELDADRDGFITFAEFLYGFATWVGLDDEEEEENGHGRQSEAVPGREHKQEEGGEEGEGEERGARDEKEEEEEEGEDEDEREGAGTGAAAEAES